MGTILRALQLSVSRVVTIASIAYSVWLSILVYPLSEALLKQFLQRDYIQVGGYRLYVCLLAVLVMLLVTTVLALLLRHLVLKTRFEAAEKVSKFVLVMCTPVSLLLRWMLKVRPLNEAISSYARIGPVAIPILVVRREGGRFDVVDYSIPGLSAALEDIRTRRRFESQHVTLSRFLTFMYELLGQSQVIKSLQNVSTQDLVERLLHRFLEEIQLHIGRVPWLSDSFRVSDTEVCWFVEPEEAIYRDDRRLTLCLKWDRPLVGHNLAETYVRVGLFEVKTKRDDPGSIIVDPEHEIVDIYARLTIRVHQWFGVTSVSDFVGLQGTPCDFVVLLAELNLDTAFTELPWHELRYLMFPGGAPARAYAVAVHLVEYLDTVLDELFRSLDFRDIAMKVSLDILKLAVKRALSQYSSRVAAMCPAESLLIGLVGFVLGQSMLRPAFVA